MKNNTMINNLRDLFLFQLSFLIRVLLSNKVKYKANKIVKNNRVSQKNNNIKKHSQGQVDQVQSTQHLMSKNKKAKLSKNSQMMLNRVKLDSLWLRQVVPLEVNRVANREVKSASYVHNNSNQDLKNHNNPKSQEVKDQII